MDEKTARKTLSTNPFAEDFTKHMTQMLDRAVSLGIVERVPQEDEPVFSFTTFDEMVKMRNTLPSILDHRFTETPEANRFPVPGQPRLAFMLACTLKSRHIDCEFLPFDIVGRCPYLEDADIDVAEAELDALLEKGGAASSKPHTTVRGWVIANISEDDYADFLVNALSCTDVSYLKYLCFLDAQTRIRDANPTQFESDYLETYENPFSEKELVLWQNLSLEDYEAWCHSVFSDDVEPDFLKTYRESHPYPHDSTELL